MTPVRVTVVAFLAMSLASCTRESNGGGKGSSVIKATLDPSIESLGETSVGNADAHFAIKTPYWRKEELVNVLGLAEHPGKKLQPAFLLLLKLPSKEFPTNGGVGSDGAKSYWDQKFSAAGQNRFSARYEINHNPVGEQITLGEWKLPLDAGRVFIVDLSAQPAKVTQVKDDLKDLVPTGDPTRENLKAAVEKLRSRQKDLGALLVSP